MKGIVSIIIIVLCGNMVMAQKIKETGPSTGSLSIGAGIDYSGLGLRADFMLYKRIALVAGGGYNLVNIGYTAGISYLLTNNEKVQPIITGLYGYNAGIVVKDVPNLNSAYNGFTLGAGVLCKRRRSENWLLQVMVPFRHQAYTDRINYLKSIGVAFKRDALPVTISLGYLVKFYKK